jgi:hypothetical protein
MVTPSDASVAKHTDVVSSTELIKRLDIERSPLAHLAADKIEKLENERVKDKVLIARLRDDLREANEAHVPTKQGQVAQLRESLKRIEALKEKVFEVLPEMPPKR